MKREGWIDVGDGHGIFYEERGKRDGPSWVYLHGGPGGGFVDRDWDFFDLEKQRVFLLYQRGCGGCTFEKLLKSNSTHYLVDDIALFLDHMELNGVNLFAGSWGCTLAVLFALKYPTRLEAMVLRGVFLSSMEERSYYENGEVSKLKPKSWDLLKSNFPNTPDVDIMSEYFNGILSGPIETSRALAFDLALYGLTVSSEDVDIEALQSQIELSDYHRSGVIYAHYSMHDFFLEDGYLWKNLDQLPDIPITLINGLHDNVTTTQWARKFKQLVPQTELILSQGGHSRFDLPIFNALKESVSKFSKT